MDAHDIETYLRDLGRELARIGMRQPLKVLMVGGAYMLTQVGNRQATNDVDVVLEEITNPGAWPFYPSFQAAVRTVAAQHALPANWLNDVISDALRSFGPVPRGTLWRSFGPLEVYVPEAEYILALKLLAGRPNDDPDARAISRQLAVTTGAEARRIVDASITDDQIKQASNVDATIARLFPTP